MCGKSPVREVRQTLRERERKGLFQLNVRSTQIVQRDRELGNEEKNRALITAAIIAPSTGVVHEGKGRGVLNTPAPEMM